MARIRSIKPEFWTSEQIVECSTNARLLFVGLWCFCDDGGVHPDSLKRIKMEVYPGDAFTEQQIKGMVDELVNVKLLRRFTVNGEAFLAVSGWHHQKIDRPHYRWPQPDDSTKFDDHSSNDQRTDVDHSSNDQRTDVDESTTDHPRNGMEWSGVEGNGSLRASRRIPTLKEVQEHFSANSIPLDPEEFFDHYASAGWRRGKQQTPITNWKLCIKSWLKKRAKEESPKPRAKPFPTSKAHLITPETMTTGILADGTSIL